MDNQDIIRRFHQAKSDRSNIEGAWRLISDFIMPFQGKFEYEGHDSEGEVNWRVRDLYDSTAVMANQNLAANLHSALTNPVAPWFDIVFRDQTLRKNHEAITWLSICSSAVFVALQESNFNLEVNETYLDLTAFGTSILVEEVLEDSRTREFLGLEFMSSPLAETYFEEDHRGRVVYFYRALKWTPLKMERKFGRENLPECIRLLLEQHKDVDVRKTVIFCIYPREVGDVDTSKSIPAVNRPYGFKYILEDEAEQLGDEGGYYEMPAYVPRWRKTTGSQWGHSPGMICLSDVLTLNELVRLILKAAEKVVDPPILTTRRGVFGDIDTDAGGVTVVASMDAFKPYESGARFDVSSLTKADLQQSIRQTFFMDQLQLKESPAMTATEVQVRYELMQRLMGPTLSRLQYDFLDPLVQRTFRILYRYGQLPKAPQVVQDAQAEFDIEYTGPMARAQKADQVAAIERWLGSLSQLAEAGYPQLLDLPDIDEAGRKMGLMAGVPPEVIKGQDVVNKLRKDRETAAKNQQTLDQMEQGSEIVKNMGGGGDALKAVVGGAATEAA